MLSANRSEATLKAKPATRSSAPPLLYSGDGASLPAPRNSVGNPGYLISEGLSGIHSALLGHLGSRRLWQRVLLPVPGTATDSGGSCLRDLVRSWDRPHLSYWLLFLPRETGSVGTGRNAADPARSFSHSSVVEIHSTFLTNTRLGVSPDRDGLVVAQYRVLRSGAKILGGGLSSARHYNSSAVRCSPSNWLTRNRKSRNTLAFSAILKARSSYPFADAS